MMKMKMIRPVLLFLLAATTTLPHSTDARLVGGHHRNFFDDNDSSLAMLSDTNINNQIKLNNSSMCQVVHDDLPPECSCKDNAAGPLSFLAACTKVFDDAALNDTIGMDLTVAPCDPEGASISLNITEQEHGINLKVAGIRAGEETNLPIPGLSAIVPPIGHIGVDAAVLISGTVDSLTLQVGLNACAVIHTHEICASSIPGLNRILPWWILKGTYSFGDVCNSNNNNHQKTQPMMMASVQADKE